MDDLTGRQLDAAVAERIFERKVKWIPDHSGVVHPYLLKEFRDGEYYVRHYSTNMADAWQVAEWIREQTGVFELLWLGDSWACGYMHTDDGPEYEYADTAPEALCRAALKLAERMEQEGK